MIHKRKGRVGIAVLVLDENDARCGGLEVSARYGDGGKAFEVEVGAVG